ncbi:class I lanthipeptide [Acidobacteriota bacterium]
MKKKFRKLSFAKETIANLTDSNMAGVRGGGDTTTSVNCTDFCPGVTARCGGDSGFCSQDSNCITDPAVTTCPSMPK